MDKKAIADNVPLKLILWGTGAKYNECVNLISYYEMQGQMKVVCVTARDLPVGNRLDGHLLLPIEEALKLEYDIVVFNQEYFRKVSSDASEKYGIPLECFINYRILVLPHLSLRKYLYLREQRPSIISNNCWGGVIYNTLGYECLSPFKNLFMTDEDYLKLLQDIEGYLSILPVYDHEACDPHSKRVYPVLKIKDIYIHCNHAADSKGAIADWERRKRKFNYDNIFVEMYTEDRESAARFEALEQFSNRVCFVPWEVEGKHQIQMQLMPGQEEFWETVNSNAGIGRNGLQYDIIELLLGNYHVRLI